LVPSAVLQLLLQCRHWPRMLLELQQRLIHQLAGAVPSLHASSHHPVAASTVQVHTAARSSTQLLGHCIAVTQGSTRLRVR
jgi:hypothetical protein